MHRGLFKSIFLLTFLLIGVVSVNFGQHYIFIEAEGQQPFYVRKGGESLSSTAAGFLILSKLKEKDLNFIIGFPNKIFPEVAFSLNGISQDRGFALKQIQGKGWVLIDRTNAAVITGGAVEQRSISSSNNLADAGFATLLAEATGDKSLIERSINSAPPVVRQQVANNKTKPAAPTVKNQQDPKPAVKPKSWSIVRSYIETNDSSLLRIAFFDKHAKEKWDTIYVEIEKSVPLSQQPPKGDGDKLQQTTAVKLDAGPSVVAQVSPDLATSAPVDCTHPIALPKDVRELQRKMSRAATVVEQIALALKSFDEKCYTTKQVKELGSQFLDEQSRLTFFGNVRKKVVDPALFGELEQSFLQENSKKAFREMLKKQPF